MAYSASFQFSGDDPVDFDIRDGDTVQGAWERIAADLGADPRRPVAFRAGGALLSGNDKPQPGQTIVATVTAEQKG